MRKKLLPDNDKKTLIWIFQRSKKQLPLIILLVVISTITSAYAAVSALITRAVVDSATDGNKDALIRNAVILAASLAAVLALGAFRSWLEGRTRIKLDVSFRHYFLMTTLGKDYSDVSSFHSGDIIARMTNDITYVFDAIISLIPGLFSLVTRIIAAFAALMVLDKRLAVIYTSLGLCLFFVSRLFRNLLKGLHKRMQETDSDVRSFSQEIIENILVVSTFNASDAVVSRLDSLLEKNAFHRKRRLNISVITNFIMRFALQVGSTGLMVFCAFKLMGGLMSYGTMTALLQLVSQVQIPFKALSGIVPSYYSTIASAERLIEITSLPQSPEIEQENPEELYSQMNSVDAEHISFSYGREMVLDDSSVSIRKGEFVVISGISGIGKSTFLKLLLGILNPSSGKLTLNMDRGCVPIGRQHNCMFAYVPQGNMLLSGTIRDNITFMGDENDEDKIREAIRISCSDEFVYDLPDGLETVIGERGKGLSEGQVQRLAIARAVLRGSPILLLDEATSALDEKTEERLLQNIRELKDKTCVIISHKHAALTVCDTEFRIIGKKIYAVSTESWREDENNENKAGI